VAVLAAITFTAPANADMQGYLDFIQRMSMSPGASQGLQE
jgi:hypothetical protein